MQGLAKQSDKYMGEVRKLPSNYQVGDEVCLSFGTGPLIPKCHITKVIFTRTKVLYDVEIPIYEPGETNDGYLPTCVGHTRIHSVDSTFVKPFDYDGFKWSPRTTYPDSNEMVDCMHNNKGFKAFVKLDANGLEWFYSSGRPISDAEQFEWRYID